jgi:sec-independent protein translocase protein TatA
MFGLRLPEILAIAGLMVLLFGASRLPQLGSSIGSAIRNFKRGFSGEDQPAEGAPADAKKLAEGQPASVQQAAEKAKS